MCGRGYVCSSARGTLAVPGGSGWVFAPFRSGAGTPLAGRARNLRPALPCGNMQGRARAPAPRLRRCFFRAHTAPHFRCTAQTPATTRGNVSVRAGKRSLCAPGEAPVLPGGDVFLMPPGETLAVPGGLPAAQGTHGLHFPAGICGVAQHLHKKPHRFYTPVNNSANIVRKNPFQKAAKRATIEAEPKRGERTPARRRSLRAQSASNKKGAE